MRNLRKVPEYGAHVAMDLPAEPDLLQRLNYEHRQIRQLWADLQRAHGHRVEGGWRPEPRLLDASEKDLVHMIVELLGQHEAVEVAVLYPAAAKVMSGPWADGARADHADLRARLEAIDGDNPEDEAIYGTLADIMTRVLAHIDEEEKIVFPAMRMDLAPAELAALRHPGEIEMLPPPPAIERSAADRQLGNGHDDGVIDLSDRDHALELEAGDDDAALDDAALDDAALDDAALDDAALDEMDDVDGHGSLMVAAGSNGELDAGMEEGAGGNGHADGNGNGNGNGRTRRRLLRRR